VEIIPYDPAKDVAFYKADGKFYESDSTMLFIAFPKDAHMPGIKIDGENPIVKKIVIKVKKGLIISHKRDAVHAGIIPEYGDCNPK
jgi:beta-galactosidase beta subunit